MMESRYYIGVCTSFHDPSITIINQEGKILFAEATERNLQLKRALGCPADPVIWMEEILKKYCDLNGEFYIAVTWSSKIRRSLFLFSLILKLRLRSKNKVLSKKLNFFFSPIISHSEYTWSSSIHTASVIQSGLSIERILKTKYSNSKVKKIHFDHHYTHAAGACYASSFKEAICLVMDGNGEKGSYSYYKYNEQGITRIGYNKGHESLGFFYSIITQMCGFDYVKGEEWKVMGLSAYGKIDEYIYNRIKDIYEVNGLKMKFKFDSDKIQKLLLEVKEYIASSEKRDEVKIDLAYTGQLLFEEHMDSIINELHELGDTDNLIYTGGCALNSSYNGKITTNTPFKKVYIPSCPGDDGSSLGAAFLAYLKENPDSRLTTNKVLSPYLGSSIEDSEIKKFLKYSNFKNYQELSDDSIYKVTAKKIAEGKIVGWIQGRAEFGPRALGNRSILADPRDPDIKDRINANIKFREGFRPFAPSVLEAYGSQYFENFEASPYMERTLQFKEEVTDKIPAVVHYNKTGRLQTVREALNPKFHKLITAFHKETGVPLVLNTSFNVMGKPMVHSFADTIQVFFNSGMDVLVVNNYLFEKKAN